MTKISKKLTNVLYIKAERILIERFLKEVKDKGISVISVRCPKDMTDISTTFVDNNWKVSRFDLNKKLIYVKPSSSEIYIIYADERIKKLLLHLVRGYKFDAESRYLVENGDKSVINTDFYKKGKLSKETRVSERFKSCKYSVTRCFN